MKEERRKEDKISEEKSVPEEKGVSDDVKKPDSETSDSAKKTSPTEDVRKEAVPSNTDKRASGRSRGPRARKEFDMVAWKPKTSIGKKVKEGQIKDINEVLDSGTKILEAGIIDVLLPGIESDLLLIGQSKGKFGGGQKRVFKQTQKKTREGNKPKFATMAVVGNKDGYVGIGYGKSKETVPAREKAIRNAKISLIKIRSGCGSWQCNCGTPHSIPVKIHGKCGSVKIKLMPAPKGTGLVIEPECAKILSLAGIKDVWSKTIGQTKTKTNMIMACFDALKNLSKTRIQHQHKELLSLKEGKTEKKEDSDDE